MLGLQLLNITGDEQQGVRAQECKLNAVTDMVRCFADVVDGATGAPPSEGPDPVQVIVGLYQAKAAGAHQSALYYASHRQQTGSYGCYAGCAALRCHLLLLLAMALGMH